MKRLVAIAIASLATVNLLAACSHETANPPATAPIATTPTTATPTTVAPTTAATLSDADFITQVNALCSAEGQAIDALIGPLFATGQPTPDSMQEALDSIVQLSRTLALDIDALAEPSDLSNHVAALVRALAAGTDEAASRTGQEFFAANDNPWAAATALADEYGFAACGEKSG